MKFLELIENLQRQNEGYIILIKSGIFFMTVGKDAIKLNEEIGLKRTCMRKELCKVGFQVRSVEKYISKMKEKDLAFQIYNYNKETETQELIYINEGNNRIESEYVPPCENCSNQKYTETEIIERLRNYGKTS